MTSILKIAIIFFTLMQLTACGENNSNNSSENNKNPENLTSTNDIKIDENQYFSVKSPKICSLNNQNKFVYEVLHDSYLWNTQVDTVDSSTNNYSSPEDLLKALKSPNDKFSFIIDQETAQSYFEEGKNNDFGLGLQIIKLTNTTFALVVTYLYPNAPAQESGIKRGNIITKVDTLEISESNLDKIIEILNTHQEVNFTIINNFISPDNFTTKNIFLNKKTYSINPVLYTNVYSSTTQRSKVAYMVFQDFLDTAKREVDRAFTLFQKENVTDMILDLRYNGGGSDKIANHLASLIGGKNVNNTVLHRINFNTKYSQFNESSNFEAIQKNSLNLKRIFILTTQRSCSASELVINAFKSSSNDVEVIQLGDTTCGKPYGFIGSGIFCNKALYAINMETTNGEGNGGYVNGLTPTCKIDDDIFKEFGDTTESLLSSALSYINTQRCPTQERSKQKRDFKISHDLQLPEKGFKRIKNGY